MIVLAVCNHKGGSGKTTSTINVAAALGLSGFRTLVIDLDPQGFLTRMVGLPEPPEANSSLVLFDPQVRLAEVPVQPRKNFDVLPASSTLSKIMRRLNQPTDVLWVKEALEQAPLPYDAVLFDTAAAITVFSLNALVASRHVLIPVMPEYQPVLGAEQTFQTVMMVRDKLNPTLNLPFFLFTMVDARKRNHHAYRRYLRQRYGDQVMSSIIRTSTTLSVTHNDGTTVFDHEPHGRGARDYANATDELLRRIAPERMDRAVSMLSREGGRGPWKSITHLG
ncbi:ParA family protein [Rhodocaloribacter litoris]|uniref:ParA family protein n=1 Tax=Rhodocaloribacter litoris TaxID=2558931 RepID=UPI00141FF6FB|nr:ParA family protein [Rhodocaloribacter litoris]QXD15986.1 ParA family protein [Rhodocaloribacter litoris]